MVYTIAEAIDPRNVTDQFKGMNDDIIRGEQEKRRSGVITIALNLTNDFNKATALRNHSGFAGQSFYLLNLPNNMVIGHPEGRKHFNRRGTVGTHKYNDVHHYDVNRWTELFAELREQGYTIVAVDNIEEFNPVAHYNYEFPEKTAIIMGEEGTGIPREIIEGADAMVYIPMFGVSPRSFNVGVAHGIVMSEYMRQNHPVD